MIDFTKQLRQAYDGDAWYGSNIAEIISAVKFDHAFRRPIPNAHTIAELVLHVTAWTEEVISRLMDNIAKEPERGDWPVVSQESRDFWNNLLSDFHLANDKLINFSMAMAMEQWQESVNHDDGRIISNRSY